MRPAITLRLQVVQKRQPSNQAMQRTASQPAIYFLRVCQRPLAASHALQGSRSLILCLVRPMSRATTTKSADPEAQLQNSSASLSQASGSHSRRAQSAAEALSHRDRTRLRQLQLLCDWFRTDRAPLGLYRLYRSRRQWSRLVLYSPCQPTRSSNGTRWLWQATRFIRLPSANVLRQPAIQHSSRLPQAERRRTAGKRTRKTYYSFSVSKAAAPPKTTKGLTRRSSEPRACLRLTL